MVNGHFYRCLNYDSGSRDDASGGLSLVKEFIVLVHLQDNGVTQREIVFVILLKQNMQSGISALSN